MPSSFGLHKGLRVTYPAFLMVEDIVLPCAIGVWSGVETPGSIEEAGRGGESMYVR